jgi:MSHA pilin protein MshA
MKSYTKASSGFTLIELIVVIVILGVLSVTAAPRFLNFATDARIAALKGLSGAVNSAMELTVSAAAIKGTTALPGGFSTLLLDGDNITLTPSGYPATWLTGLQYVVNVDSSEWEIDHTGFVLVIRPKGMVDSEKCFFEYNASNTNSRPVLSTTTDEC